MKGAGAVSSGLAVSKFNKDTPTPSAVHSVRLGEGANYGKKWLNSHIYIKCGGKSRIPRDERTFAASGNPFSFPGLYPAHRTISNINNFLQSAAVLDYNTEREREKRRNVDKEDGINLNRPNKDWF